MNKRGRHLRPLQIFTQGRIFGILPWVLGDEAYDTQVLHETMAWRFTPGFIPGHIETEHMTNDRTGEMF